jgi:predicted RNase H-related nuclease YkuK (DUF458 family)
MKNFRKFGGQEIEDLGVYLRDYYAQYPRVKIFVGTDSLQSGKFTKYVTTVCMLHPEYIDNGKFHYSSGVHVVYRRENVKRIRDVFSRLWKETELTFEVSQYVHESLKEVWKQPLNNEKIPIVHLDFSNQPQFKSHQVHDTSMGYIKGHGFEVYAKPMAWSATYASDWLCQ